MVRGIFPRYMSNVPGVSVNPTTTGNSINCLFDCCDCETVSEPMNTPEEFIKLKRVVTHTPA